MIDVKALIKKICDYNVINDDEDLIDNGVLDSYALIELLGTLEDQGVTLVLTRIDRTKLRTIKGIEALILEARR